MRISTSVSGGAAAPTKSYPYLGQGDSGTVWLMTGPKTGTVVHLGRQPFSRKTVAFGYATGKLKESGLKPFNGQITLSAAA